MQPVEPSTIVRGPAAFTMCRITRADSHPWQVRCPETKSSSYGTSLTPLICGRFCAGMISVVIVLLPYADPMAGVARGEVAARGRHGLLEDLGRHRLLDLAAAEAGDEPDDHRTLGLRVQRRADLVVEHASVVRRAEAVVAVDHAHGLESPKAFHDLLRREGPEPFEADEADLEAPLLAQTADRDLHRERQRPLADDHDLGIVGHVLVEERAFAAAAEG